MKKKKKRRRRRRPAKRADSFTLFQARVHYSIIYRTFHSIPFHFRSVPSVDHFFDARELLRVRDVVGPRRRVLFVFDAPPRACASPRIRIRSRAGSPRRRCVSIAAQAHSLARRQAAGNVPKKAPERGAVALPKQKSAGAGRDTGGGTRRGLVVVPS